MGISPSQQQKDIYTPLSPLLAEKLTKSVYFCLSICRRVVCLSVCLIVCLAVCPSSLQRIVTGLLSACTKLQNKKQEKKQRFDYLLALRNRLIFLIAHNRKVINITHPTIYILLQVYVLKNP